MPTSTVTSPRAVETLQFGPLVVHFDERVLRPRPWTLAQSTWGAELLPDLPAGAVLEICAGAGHIGSALALSTDRPVLLVDADRTACEYARLNTRLAGLAGRVEVRHGPMDAALDPDERFALVLADPPYLPSSDTASYPADPLSAVDGGDDGLDLARQCLAEMAEHLVPGGAGLLQLRDREQVHRIATYVAERPRLGLTARDSRVLAEGAVLLLGKEGPWD
jgi:methylase of polypeptide subunit release factors